jgi:hypothetical protein
MSNKRSSKSNLCTYTFSNGNSCRMLAHPDHGKLCFHHATSTPSCREDDLGVVFSETGEGDYISSIDINHALGHLFQALAENRISNKRAATLSNIGRTLLLSQRCAIEEAKYWFEEEKMQRKILRIKYPGTHGDVSNNNSAPSEPQLQAENA